MASIQLRKRYNVAFHEKKFCLNERTLNAVTGNTALLLPAFGYKLNPTLARTIKTPIIYIVVNINLL
jgi:hypothetical protein